MESQNRANMARVAWQKFINARQFLRETQKWVISLCRLAAQGLTARQFLHETRSKHKMV